MTEIYVDPTLAIITLKEITGEININFANYSVSSFKYVESLK